MLRLSGASQKAMIADCEFLTLPANQQAADLRPVSGWRMIEHGEPLSDETAEGVEVTVEPRVTVNVRSMGGNYAHTLSGHPALYRCSGLPGDASRTRRRRVGFRIPGNAAAANGPMAGGIRFHFGSCSTLDRALPYQHGSLRRSESRVLGFGHWFSLTSSSQSRQRRPMKVASFSELSST